MNPSPFSARQVLPGPGQPLRGERIRVRSRVRPGQRGALAADEPAPMVPPVLPLLLWRMLRVFGKPLRPKVEERAA